MMCNDSTQTPMEKGGSVPSQLARQCSLTHRLHYFLCRPLGPLEEAKHFYLSESTFLFWFFSSLQPWMRHLQLQQPQMERAHSVCKGMGRHRGQLINSATSPDCSEKDGGQSATFILQCTSTTALLPSSFIYRSKSSGCEERRMHHTMQQVQSSWPGSLLVLF